MKRQIVKLLIGTATTILLAGSNSITASGQHTTQKNNTSNITSTVSGNITDSIIEHLIAHIQEIIKIVPIQNNAFTWDRTEVYFTRTKKDYDAMTEILENRNGKIIIEISNGTVLDADGNGVDDLGYYRHYDMSRFSVSDYVQSVFIYNSDTNSVDDILYRTDILIE